MNAEEQVQKVRDVVKNWNDFLAEAASTPGYDERSLAMMRAARNDITEALGDER